MKMGGPKVAIRCSHVCADVIRIYEILSNMMAGHQKGRWRPSCAHVGDRIVPLAPGGRGAGGDGGSTFGISGVNATENQFREQMRRPASWPPSCSYTRALHLI